MSLNRLHDYVFHMQETASDACDFVVGFSKAAFLADRRTQRAVLMSLIILGEAASKLGEKYPEFTRRHPEIPWSALRGMRNRIAHGYFDINLEVVWNTLESALPKVRDHLQLLRVDAEYHDTKIWPITRPPFRHSTACSQESLDIQIDKE